MKARRLHRVIGMMMLLPMLGWAATGLVFFLKPGYSAAYEMLALRTYPLEGNVTITPQPAWLEVRASRTILGRHLLVRTTSGWQHLNPDTMTERAAPTPDEVKALLTDAFTAHPQRYGTITAVTGNVVTTSTHVQVTLDWKRLSLQQRGRDTDWIDRLYKIHYLQWTGVQAVDKVLGIVGLVLLVGLSGLGLWLQVNASRNRLR